MQFFCTIPHIMAHYCLIACKALKPEIEFLLAEHPPKHAVELQWMQQGLHNTPAKLRSQLQDKLDTLCSYDAVLLAYGLCGGGLAGLRCPLPLVIPRAHDCISLLFGSRRAHEQFVNAYPGTYFYSVGWVQEANMPCREYDQRLADEYISKYGPDNADYLLDIEHGWRKKYKQAVFIDWNLPDSSRGRQFTREAAAYLGWDFAEVKGSPAWLLRLLQGDWRPDEFLVLKPNQPLPDDFTGSCMMDFQP